MALLSMACWACYTPVKPGSGLYFYSPVDVADAIGPDSTLNGASFLELRPDGSYTQDFGHFDFGTWMLREQRLYLTNQHHRTYIYLVADSLQPEKLTLQLDGGRIGRFYKQTMPAALAEKDPFSAFNNQWRIPAIHKESDAEVKKRLYNHCQFWEAYFAWVKDNQGGPTDVRDIPSPLKIYGNGFGLKHYDDLPRQWRSYFYDSADCHKADTMIKHTFRRHDFAWPKTDDDLKRLASGMHQLQGWLK